MTSLMGKNNKIVMGFAGKAGAGKTYVAQKTIEQLKSQGLRIAVIGYADPIKMLLREFGITKSGPMFESILVPDPQITYSIITEYFMNVLMKATPEWKGGKNESDLLVDVGMKVHKYLDQFQMHLDQVAKSIDDDEEYKFHYRKLITMTGTEIGRGISEEIWINDLVLSAKEIFGAGINSIFVDDVRFFNEYKLSQKLFRIEGIDMEVWGVTAPDSTRAARQGISQSAVFEHNKHSSEKEVDLILADLPKERIIENK